MPSWTPTPGLVRSMSVQPPRGQGRVRLIEIVGVDLQPCGGTQVANTAGVGAVVVTKIAASVHRPHRPQRGQDSLFGHRPWMAHAGRPASAGLLLNQWLHRHRVAPAVWLGVTGR